MENQKNLVEENIEKEQVITEKNNKFGEFMRKNGFYIGVFLIFVLVIIVMTSDRTQTYKGNVDYEYKVFFADNNQLYIKDDNKEPKLLSSNLMTTYSGMKLSKILLMCKISEDQEYIYFFENVDVDDAEYHGDLVLYKDNKSITIAYNVPLSYALSSDLNTVVYASSTGQNPDGSYLYNLYKYDNGNSTLIAENVDKNCFTLSGDGNVIYYNKGYYAETGTSAMYMYKDGQSAQIDNQIVYYYKLNANGTYKSNWPMTNTDGSKVIYAGYAGENALPSLNIYKVSDGSSAVISDNFAQVFVDENLDRAIINGDIRGTAMIGSFIKCDLNTLNVDYYENDIWALTTLEVSGYVDEEFLDFNFYLKSFDEITLTADLYFKGEGKEEEKVVSGVFTDDIKISKDFTELYVLGYYFSAEGGELTRISNITSSSYKSEMIDERVSEYHFDDMNSVLGYRQENKLYLIDGFGNSKMVDNHGVTAFDITSNGNLLYFYKDNTEETGIGELYVMETDVSKDYQLVDQATTFVYEFGNDYVAYINEFDFGQEDGKLVVTDGNNNFELVAEKASTLLMKNTIK